MCKKLICLLTVMLLASSASAATLVLDWDLDGNFNDSTANGYNASEGNATACADRFGTANSAMDFALGTDWAAGWGFVGGSVGDLPCKVGEALTINVWAKMETVGAWGTWNSKCLAMAGIGDPTDSTIGNNRMQALEYTAMNQPGTSFFWGEAADYNSGVQASLSVWQMYTLVTDGINQVSLYLSNYGDTSATLAGSGTTSANLSDSCYMVNLSNANGEGTYAPPGWAYDFVGQMDDFQIYRGALTKAEIDALVPEPATIALLGLGGLVLLRRRK